MASLLDAPRVAARVEGVLHALVAGFGAAVAGLLVVTALVLTGWAAPGTEAGGSGNPSAIDALRIVGVGWLAAHHVPLLVPSGPVAWLPLGLLVIPVVTTFLAGRWIVRRSGPMGRWLAFICIIAMSGTYAAVAAGIAAAASSDAVRAQPVLAAAAACLVAVTAGSVGMWRAAWSATPWRRVPHAVKASVVAGLAGLFTLIGGGALLTVAAVATNRDAVGRVVTALDAGMIGSALLLLLSAAYVPNVVIWAAAYAVGPGFAVGTGTSVSVRGVEVGQLPALPLLGALPPPGPASVLSVVAILVPVVAGVIVGRVLARRLPSGRWVVGWAVVAAGVGGVALAVLAVLAGGPLGGGRFAVLGPSPWQVAGAATLELALVAAPTAWLTSRRLR